jgi:protein dithiol oxidoreductase (disulfide-forming)
MKRWALGIFLLSIIGIGCAAVEEGKQYKLIEPAVIVHTPNNEVEVIEFFSYGCPHCATLAPYFSEWEAKKPNYVVVKKVPVEFNSKWESYAKLYYTAESLKVTDKMDKVIFDAIQKGTDVSNEEVAADLFAQNGVDPDVFKKTYNSFSVNTALNQGRFLAQQYKIMQVPQVIVDGRYKTDMSMTGGPQGIGSTLDVLVEKANALRQTTTK